MLIDPSYDPADDSPAAQQRRRQQALFDAAVEETASMKAAALRDSYVLRLDQERAAHELTRKDAIAEARKLRKKIERYRKYIATQRQQLAVAEARIDEGRRAVRALVEQLAVSDGNACGGGESASCPYCLRVIPD